MGVEAIDLDAGKIQLKKCGSAAGHVQRKAKRTRYGTAGADLEKEVLFGSSYKRPYWS
jgi:hypothetical protein